MAGKARRASEDLDSEKNAALQAKIEQERSDRAEERDWELYDQNSLIQANANAAALKNENDITAATVAHDRAVQTAKTLAQGAVPKPVEYTDIRDTTGKTTIEAWATPNGMVTVGSDGQLVPLNQKNYVRTGQLVATTRDAMTVGGADFSPTVSPGTQPSQSVVGRLINSGDPEMLDRATKTFNYERWLSKVSLGENAGEIQDVHRDMATVLVSGMAANLEKMDAKPVSDYEGRIARMPVPSEATMPYGWVGWAANTYRAGSLHEMNLAIAETRQSGDIEKAEKQEDIRDQIMLEHDMDTIHGAIDHKYPLKKLVSAGIDPKLIELVQLLREVEGR